MNLQLITYNHKDIEFYNNIEFIDEFIRLTKNNMVIYDIETWNKTPFNMKQSSINVIVIEPKSNNDQDDIADLDCINHIIVMSTDSFSFIFNKLEYIYKNEKSTVHSFIFTNEYLKKLLNFHIRRIYFVDSIQSSNKNFNTLKLDLIDNYFSFKNINSFNLNTETTVSLYDMI